MGLKRLFAAILCDIEDPGCMNEYRSITKHTLKRKQQAAKLRQMRKWLSDFETREEFLRYCSVAGHDGEQRRLLEMLLPKRLQEVTH